MQKQNKETKKKSCFRRKEERMTASVLKQQPNIQKVQRNAYLLGQNTWQHAIKLQNNTKRWRMRWRTAADMKTK